MTAPAATSMFRRAERTAVKLKIGIQGPSGSGKTEGALHLARAIAGPTGRIAVIDTEAGSASLYSDRFEFDTVTLSPPYWTKRYVELLDAAIAEGYDVVVIDSISHQWAGEGGILSRKDEADSRGGSSFNSWAKFTPEHDAFRSKLLNAPVHLICTLRAKHEYIVETKDGAKATPKKMGMAPIQREGMEYEFAIMFDMQMDHKAGSAKDRTTLYDGQLIDFRDKATVQKLIDWHQSAKPAAPAPAGPTLVKDEAAETPAAGTLAWAQAYRHPKTGTALGAVDSTGEPVYPTGTLEEIMAWCSSRIAAARKKGEKPNPSYVELGTAAKLVVEDRARQAALADVPDAPAPAVEQASLLPEPPAAPAPAKPAKQSAADSIYNAAERLNRLLNSPSVSERTKAELRPSILTKGTKNTAANVAWFVAAIERVEEEILASGGTPASAPAPEPPPPTATAPTSVADELIAAAAGDDLVFP